MNAITSNSFRESSFKVDVSEVDTEVLFAEDLMYFVMQGYELPFPRTPTFLRSPPVRFVPCVGHVVRYLSSLQEDKTLTAFDYLRCTILSGDHFDEFASGMVEAHFSGEFQMLDFLCFCAQLTRLSVLFYLNNITDAPVKTVSVIGNALQKEKLRFLSSGGWDTLYDLCFNILHRIPRKQRCRVPTKETF
ncbi:uncharacterized protein CDAR_128351 [Caerostris darwini]|uniref:Uncharacterized protein n=2 Tax=Caerostris TaxID=172845 RepID=A0AAV4RWG3_9ARAC|nr:uncharacterized protein CEXT_98751 [Caerostris extrusa]GIY26233.1 uncharacterized protein CDAR_128351 [Caerostris darwini]